MLFDLPTHTPTPAIVYTFGTLYTHLRIERKRLMYLHRLLNKPDTSWTKRTLLILDQLNIGWAKSIRETLNDLGLPTDFSSIRTLTKRQWMRYVDAVIEVKNRNRLLNDCHKTVDSQQIRKSKTTHIVDHIEEWSYTRGPAPELLFCNKQEAKTLMIARFGMLECGKNFKGSMKEICDTCKVIDNEDHRLNHCIIYRNVNLYDMPHKVDFSSIFSSDMNTLREMIKIISKVWNVTNAHGSMYI